MERPLIVGIDPGTTVAYAALDLKGTVVEVGSAKHWSLADVITRLMRLGLPLAVGTDRASVPGLVESLRAKVGARLIHPPLDLSVEEKRHLTEDCATRNDHERDALAAALYAYRALRPLLQKVFLFAEENHEEANVRELMALVLRDEKLSIRRAFAQIRKEEEKELREKEEKEDGAQRLPKITRESIASADAEALRAKIRSLKRENLLREADSHKHRKLARKLKERYRKLRKETEGYASEAKLRELLALKDRRLQSLYREVAALKVRIASLEEESRLLVESLARAKTHVVLKKMQNLSLDEYTKKEKVLHVQEGDILLVDDLSTVSQAVVDKLRSRVSVIVYRGAPTPPAKSLNGFMQLNARNFSLQETEHVALMRRDDLDAAKKDRDLITHVVNKYRSQRR